MIGSILLWLLQCVPKEASLANEILANSSYSTSSKTQLSQLIWDRESALQAHSLISSSMLFKCLVLYHDGGPLPDCTVQIHQKKCKSANQNPT